MRLRAWLHAQVTATVSSTPLALLRIGLGVAAFVKSWDWAFRIDGARSLTLFAVYQLLAIALTIGTWSRLAAAGLAGLNLVYIYVAGFYNNHLAFLTALLVLLVLSDSGATLSVAARRRGARGSVAVWPVTLLKLQLFALYLFSAVNKLNGVFWTGDTIRSIADRALLWPHPGQDPLVWLLVAMGVSTVLWELTAPVCLWRGGWPRVLAFMAGPLFHIGMLFVLSSSWLRIHGIAVFAIASLSTYALFLDMDPGEGLSRDRSAWARWLGLSSTGVLAPDRTPDATAAQA